MKKKTKKKKSISLPKKVGLTALALFLLIAVAVEIIQSDWAKDKAKTLLANALLESGFQVEIGKIEGSLPQYIKLESVSIRGKGLAISVRSAEARLSLIRLLKREVAFTTLNAEGIRWKALSPNAAETAPTASGYLSGLSGGLPKPDFAIYIEHFYLKDVLIPDYGSAEFTGRMRLSKKKNSLTVKARRQGFPESSAQVLAVVKQDGEMQLRATVNTPTLKAFAPSDWAARKAPEDASLSAEIVAAGPLASLWTQSAPLQTPLRGRISGKIIPKETAAPEAVKSMIERNWSFYANFNKQEALSLSKIAVKSDFVSIKGKASFDPSFRFSNANFQLVSEKILSALPIHSSGRLIAQLQIKSENDSLQASTAWKIPLLHAHGVVIQEIKGNTSGSWKNGELSGSSQATGTILSENWKGKTDFSWKPHESLLFKNGYVEAQGLTLKAKGDLEVRPDWLLAGTTELEIGNLQSLQIPDLELYGSLTAKGEWKPVVEPGTSLQGLYLDMAASDLYYGPFYARKASLYSDLLDPFHSLAGNLDVTLEQFHWGYLSLSYATLETKARGLLKESQPFKIFAEGKWKHPLEIQIDGSWNYNNKTFIASILNWKGAYFNHPFAMEDPVQFEWSPDIFRLRGLAFSLDDAEISGFIDRQGEKTDAGLKLAHMPIDLLSVNPLELPIAGTLNLDASIHEEKGQLKGDLSASIEKLEIEETEETLPEIPGKLPASGTITGHFDKNRLDLKGNLQSRGAPLMDLDLSIPIHFSLFPFRSEILYYLNAKGKIALNGRIEDFLDFFDLKSHRLEGDCQCDFRFSNTLNRPKLEGFCTFKNGFYQNYYSGTELHHIEANWKADKEILSLVSLTAQDAPEMGRFSAVGEITVRPEDLFPFRFDVSFDHLNFVQIDLVTAAADGKIHIAGNRTSAVAKGNIEIINTELTIPSHIPRPLPNLQVVYVNAIHPSPPPETKASKPYPLFLELHVSTPEKIAIAGRGLNSEWLGDFDIGGTYSSITAKGKLELDNGEFVFGGRSFKLTEGGLSFSGKEHEMPYINIAGSAEQKGITIIARIKGALNSPQITFQSVPPLPLSSIMSYLLFGQKIGEISGFQALQLATSIASLAGQGPDILESTRKALGLDRLRIIANPTEEGGETIALEVGTYVTEGVIVSLSQGAEDSSTNISIEVEIRDNFSFQAESQQQTEQGKFSFKWFVNY